VFLSLDTEAINIEVTGNSHHGNADHKVTNKIPEEGEDAADGEVKQHVNRKEKSVLQSKLTRLAIQIGYAGMSQKNTENK